MQLQILKRALLFKKSKAPKIPFIQEQIKQFVSSIPFQLTFDQKKAAWKIIKDLEKETPMNRLLQGDVGSGKTVVAAIAIFSAVKAGFQSAFLAPTEILAQQHFSTLDKFLTSQGIIVRLLTSGTKSKEKKEIYKLISRGEIDCLAGTHALFNEKLKFSNLGLLIVDEQHRFGVNQRAALIRRQTQTLRGQTPMEDKLLYEELTYKIRGAVFKIKDELGIGHKENIYHRALLEELKNQNILYATEKNLNITYNGKKIGTYKPDLIVDDKIIIELKALPFVGATEKKQLWSYLKGSQYRLALLINFGPQGVEINRVIYDSSRNKSASSRRESAFSPHLLSMTATPIPRTLALTLCGDLSISSIAEMPPGRTPVETQIIPHKQRQKAYALIRREILAGRQGFIICPLIEESDVLEVKSAIAEHKRLAAEIFPNFSLGLLHGKLSGAEKEKVMKAFKAGEYHLLVSTSVVEVGIDVPNATVMLVEGAERFGLAQLHQFRGRVGRGKHASYCLLLPSGDTIPERIKVISKYHDGFKLAEMDLKFRGMGQLFGVKQSGFLDFKIADPTDLDLVKKARNEAEKIISQGIGNYPELKKIIKEETAHPE
ncbi:MAG: hypothetical protein A3D92_15565 [Bacteroidetes bacterium RIFCSPHIGHO2_02_FULL_44_7]|nr:MAG: hypothetical protein A3D92_15565 [Bacteroidetes bacterium RIFCSPHIGHO2_02_FULL_44_7]